MLARKKFRASSPSANTIQPAPMRKRGGWGVGGVRARGGGGGSARGAGQAGQSSGAGSGSGTDASGGRATHRGAQASISRADRAAVERVLSYAPAIRKGGNRAKDIALTFDD